VIEKGGGREGCEHHRHYPSGSEGKKLTLTKLRLLLAYEGWREGRREGRRNRRLGGRREGGREGGREGCVCDINIINIIFRHAETDPQKCAYRKGGREGGREGGNEGSIALNLLLIIDKVISARRRL